MSRMAETDKFALFTIFVLAPLVWAMTGEWIKGVLIMLVSLVFLILTSAAELRRRLLAERRPVREGRVAPPPDNGNQQ